MKKGMILLLSGLLLPLISAASAISVYQDMDYPVIALVFIIIFALINYSLSKGNAIQDTATRTVLSLSITGIIIYYIMKSGFSIIDFFYQIGVGEILVDAAPIAIIVLLIFVMIKWGFWVVVMGIGALLALAGLIGGISDLVYNWEIPVIVGAAIMLIGFFFHRKYYKGIGRGFMAAVNKLEYLRVKTLNSIKKIDKEIERIKRRYQRETDPDKRNKIYKDYENLVARRNQLAAEEQQVKQKEKVAIQRVERERLNLQKQYDTYSNEMVEITRRYGGRIPSDTNGKPQEERQDAKRYSSLAKGMKNLRKIGDERGAPITPGEANPKQPIKRRFYNY